MPTLLVIRHAKSDWSQPFSDRQRPLARRGRRQAPAVGDWLADHHLVPDLVVCSPARRARDTWDLVATALMDAGADLEGIDVWQAEAAYTFDGQALLRVTRQIPPDEQTVALVGHNPALEELVAGLTGRFVRMPTSALAVIDVPSWVDLDEGQGLLRAAGRPADGEVELR